MVTKQIDTLLVIKNTQKVNLVKYLERKKINLGTTLIEDEKREFVTLVKSF